ncbi:MAG: exonuclease SbcCD subunit D [Candidatus Sigynarchaeota archaeon]
MLKKPVKFLHLADPHLGCWKDDKLNARATDTLAACLKMAVDEKVDFVIIAGDIFDISYPKVDVVNDFMKLLLPLHDKGIPVYVIAGSHDYSATGKTMVKVFATSRYVKNVFVPSYTANNKLHLDFVVDANTGVKICGIPGQVRGLDAQYYQVFDRQPLEAEPGYKIFVLHNVITETKEKDMVYWDSIPRSMLPAGFNYYAGGHVHRPLPKDLATRTPIDASNQVIFPGVMFPTDFAEMEGGLFGGYCLVDVDVNGKTTCKWGQVKLVDVLAHEINAGGKAASAVNAEISALVSGPGVKGKYVLVRVAGTLASGSVADIRWREIEASAMKSGAEFFSRNTEKFASPDVSIIKLSSSGKTQEQVEDDIITENLGKVKVKAWKPDDEKRAFKAMLDSCVMRWSKDEGKKDDFIKARIEAFMKAVGLEKEFAEYQQGE